MPFQQGFGCCQHVGGMTQLRSEQQDPGEKSEKRLKLQSNPGVLRIQ
jgi:hypothetical protein